MCYLRNMAELGGGCARRIIKKDGAEFNILSQLADKVGQAVHIFRQGSGQMLHSRCRVNMHDDIIWLILWAYATRVGSAKA